MKHLASLSLVATLVAGCALEPLEETSAHATLTGAPIPVVFDHDADFDDIAALAYLAQAHKQGIVDLRAVTVANNGAGLPGFAIHFTRCALQASGLGHIPVADNGLAIGPNFASTALRTFVQTVLLQTFPTCTASLASPVVKADALLANTIMASSNVRAIITGPATNLAKALARQPAIASRLAGVWAMTGAIEPSTSAEPNEWALLYSDLGELNAFIDPPALDALIRTFGTRFYMVGRDATQFVPMSPEFAAQLATTSTPEGQIVARIANNVVIQTAGTAGLQAYWWDPLTAVEALGANVVDFETMAIRVALSGQSLGRTFVDPSGTAIQVGLSADRAGFEAAFLTTLDP